MQKGVNMINGIGSSGNSRIGQTRTGTAGRGVAASEISPATTGNVSGSGNVSSPAAKLAQLGAPINAEKIAAIRTAIAEGRYPVDPKAIAARMIDLDLPLKF